MTALRTTLLALFALLLVPATVRAQEYSRYTITFAVLNTQPLGELSTGPGIGLKIGGAYALDPFRIFRVHGEFRASIYDHESRDVCFSSTVGCRIVLDLDTNYTIVYFGLGPQVVLPLGPASVAVDGSLGWTSFAATSTLSGVDDQDESFGDTQNYEDNSFAWSAGGELRIPLTGTVALAMGTHYQHNGVVSYLREGGIIDNPDGSLSFNPFRTEANLLAITLGVTITPFGGGREP